MDKSADSVSPDLAGFDQTWYSLSPDGFYILGNLRSKTNIPFKPYKMGISELEKYSDYTKTLEENDILKAKALIDKGHHKEIMEYMLKHNQKLEQEIISWKLKVWL